MALNETTSMTRSAASERMADPIRDEPRQRISMALRLYDHPLSPYGQKVKIALIEKGVEFQGMRDTESHIQGSLRMGTDPATSVIDAKQVHHDVRNLVVVGSSVFPSGPNSTPSLSVAALSLRSADLIA